jgi:GntR family transcriptional regulator
MIADDLLEKIESGELMPGQQLVTEQELMRSYEASRNTVRDAVKLLTLRGLVETRPGQGTFVTERPEPLVTTLSREAEARGGSEVELYASRAATDGRKLSLDGPRVEVRTPIAYLTTELRLAEDALVVSRDYKVLIKGMGYVQQTSFYPLDLVQRGATHLLIPAHLEGGPIAYIRESTGVRRAGWRDLITARVADENEASFFQLPENGQTLVFEVRRTDFDEEGSPIRLTHTIYPTDRTIFAYQEGSIPFSKLPAPKLNHAATK